MSIEDMEYQEMKARAEESENFSRANLVAAAKWKARATRVEAALRQVLSGIQTDNAQQVYITGDHFALTVEDARAVLAATPTEETDDDGHISREMMHRFHAPTEEPSIKRGDVDLPHGEEF